MNLVSNLITPQQVAPPGNMIVYVRIYKNKGVLKDSPLRINNVQLFSPDGNTALQVYINNYTYYTDFYGNQYFLLSSWIQKFKDQYQITKDKYAGSITANRINNDMDSEIYGLEKISN